MIVTVLHVRDPDDACSTRVFIDGVEAPADEIDIDAGRGYELEDWEDSIAWAEALPDSPLREVVLDAYTDPPGSKYIDGWRDRSEP